MVAITILGLYSPAMAAQRQWYGPVVGRFLTPALLLLTVPAALLRGRWLQPLLFLGLLTQLAYSVPRGVGAWDGAGALAVVVLVVALGGVVLALRRLPRRWPLVAAGLVATAAAHAQLALRDALRAPVWESACQYEDAVSQWHPIPPELIQWQAWRTAEDGAPRRIAFVAGWGCSGHNWFRYPLLGSRFQNTVVYVPVTRDGSAVDYRTMAAMREQADYRSWLERLRDVDLLVVGPPPPPELGWIAAAGPVFTPVTTGPFGEVFAIDHAALDGLLAQPPGAAPALRAPRSVFEAPQWFPFQFDHWTLGEDAWQ